MRSINLLIVHCSASDNPEQDSPEAVKYLHTANKKTKIKWGKYDTTGKGWSDNGYHYFITKDGVVHVCRPLKKAGAHCKGFNKSSIGICLSGERDFTEAQFEALRKLITELLSNHDLSIIDVMEHRELNSGKTCPNFDLRSKLKGLYGNDIQSDLQSS